MRSALPCWLASFDPRSRAGSDSGVKTIAGDYDAFRSALPRGERHLITLALKAAGVFRSALPRGERRFRMYPVNASQGVSIRAPARGATRRTAARQGIDDVSIRAPARGATRQSRWNRPMAVFRSALPRGERRLRHARMRISPCFDPRSRAGSDSLFAASTVVNASFRSALPRGERPACRR